MKKKWGKIAWMILAGVVCAQANPVSASEEPELIYEAEVIDSADPDITETESERDISEYDFMERESETPDAGMGLPEEALILEEIAVVQEVPEQVNEDAAVKALMAAETPASDFDYYEMEGDQPGETVICIDWYYGSDKKIVVPSQIDGKTVYALAKSTFTGNKEIEEVYLPDSVKKIESEAFYECTNLRVVNLGGLCAPLQWHGLSWMLHECPNLERLEMSDSANFSLVDSSVGSGNCNFDLFYQDVRDNLKYIYIGSSMENVSINLFFGKNLEQIEIGKGNPNFSSRDGMLYSPDGKELTVCAINYPQEFYRIPTGVEVIGGSSFSLCKNIKKLEIPITVTEIDRSAFSGTELTIVAEKNSYAATYAEENGIPVEYNGVHEHAYEKSVKEEPTCSRPGCAEYYCPVCKNSYTEAIPATGAHQWAVEVDKKADCEHSGEYRRVCQQCGQAEETKTEALGHAGGTATCMQKKICTRCGKEYGDLVSHQWSGWSTVKKATALAPKQQERRCLTCDRRETRSVGEKLKATIKVNATQVVLQTGQSTSKLKVTGLAKGDSVKSWKSGSTKIVKVSKSGKLTAQKKTGKTTITITLKSGLKKKIKVTVQKTQVKTSKISGVKKAVSLKKGGSYKLAPTLSPFTSQDKIKYSSSNKKVAVVNTKGKITAKKKGNAVITVQAGSKKVKCKVTVK